MVNFLFGEGHQFLSLFCQVGTLDTLVGLSDDLGKLDGFVERYEFDFMIALQTHQHSTSAQLFQSRYLTTEIMQWPQETIW